MDSPQWHGHPHPAKPPGLASSHSTSSRSSSSAGTVDWKIWCRALERKRRALDRAALDASAAQGERTRLTGADGAAAEPARGRSRAPRTFLARVTWASFQLDGIDLAEREVSDALARGQRASMHGMPGLGAFRAPQAPRLRNHVAILRRIECHIRRAQPLTAGTVIRWYANIGCGLSTALLDSESLSRLERVVRRANSPHMHLRPAVEEAVRVYWELLSDPLIPSFNGILARLLLDYHLGRCGIPPVLFDPTRDRPAANQWPAFLGHLLERIDTSYASLIAARSNGNGH